MSRAKAAPKKKAVPAESPVKVKAEETKKVSEAKEEKPKAAKSASPSPAKPTKKRAASAGPSKAESAPSPAKKQKAPAKAAKPKAEPVDADAKEASPVQPRKRKQPSRGADAAEAPAEPAADVPSSPAPAKKAKPKAKSPAASRAKKQPAKEAAAKKPEVAEPETNGDAESKTPAKAAKGGAKGKGKKAAAEESVKEAQVVADALFDNEDDSDSEFEGLEDEDADAKQVVLTEAQLSELPSIGKAKALAVKGRLSEAKGAGRGVIYLGHIPHGFFEDQMRGFFTQFGTITRLRLSRSKKTGRSRGYAFIEFETPEVAEIVAETMNNYMMFGRSLKCHVVRPEQLHADTFKGANKKFRRVPWARLAREQMNKSRTPEQQKKRVSRLQKKDNERRAKLAAMGISYQFEGYTQNGSKVEAAAEKAVASKESKPKAKAAPTKSKKAA